MQRILLWSGIGLIIVVVIVTIVLLVIRRPTANSGQPASTGPITLTLWDPIDSEDVWKPIIEKYREEHPNVKVKYSKKPLAEYEIEAINALSAGSGPDIWLVNDSWMVKHRDKLVPAEEGLFRASKQDKRTNDPVVKATFVPTVAEEGITDKKLYGLPMSVDTLAFYVNPRLMSRRQAELIEQNVKYDSVLFEQGPRTWEEFIKLIKLLTKRDGTTITQSAVAMGTAANNPRAVDLLVALMLQNGTSMESPDKLTATFNLPTHKSTGESFNPGLNALEFFTSFANPSKETYTWNNAFSDALEAFLEGKVAMIPGYSWLGQTIKQKNPEFSFSTIPLPQILGSEAPIDFGSFWFLTVSKNAKNPTASWDFVKFASSRGLSLYGSATKRPSPLKQSADALPRNILERASFGSPFTFQAETARSWYHGFEPTKVESTLSEMIEDVVSRSISTENALNKGAKTVTEIFRATTPLPAANPSNTNQK